VRPRNAPQACNPSPSHPPTRSPAQVRVARVQEGDELILACDGLWDVLSPEDAFEYLHGKNVSAERTRTRARARTLAFEYLDGKKVG